MAGLASRSWKQSYKSTLIISGASAGAGTAQQQLTTGDGVTIPLYVASGSLRIDSGKKFYFSDTDLDNYIYNSSKRVLAINTGTKLVVSPKLQVSNISMASLIGTAGYIKTLTGSTASFKGLAKAGTLSAAAIKGTTAVVTTVSATTIKGSFTNAGKSGAVNVLTGSGKVKFASSPEYSIGLGTDNKCVVLTANNVKSLMAYYNKIIPSAAGIDMGANAAASRWSNLYAASATFKTLVASTGTIKAGALSAATVKGTAATVSTLLVNGNIQMKTGTGKYYGDQSGLTCISGGTAFKFTNNAKGFEIYEDGKFLPTDTGFVFGSVSYHYTDAYFDKAVVDRIAAPKITLSAASYLLIASVLPATSTGLLKGQIWADASGFLKIVPA